MATDNDKQKQQLLDELITNMPYIEKELLNELFSILDKLDYKGGIYQSSTIGNKELIEIKNKINETLVKKGYLEKVNLFIQDIGKITINSNIILDSEGFNYKKYELNEIEKKWQTLTKESLLNSGIRSDFETPILEILNDSISYGTSITEAKKRLSDYILEGKDNGGKLTSYTTVVARDTLGQMQGQQLQSIAEVNGYEAIRYTGGLLNDSRGQCYHWVKELNGIIKKDKLEEEIKLAYKNQKNKLVTNGTHKWSGMMPNTTIDNFITKRGGYGCLHTAIPIKKVGK